MSSNLGGIRQRERATIEDALMKRFGGGSWLVRNIDVEHPHQRKELAGVLRSVFQDVAAQAKADADTIDRVRATCTRLERTVTDEQRVILRQIQDALYGQEQR